MREFLFALDWSMNFYKLHWFLYSLINAIKCSPDFSTIQHDSDCNSEESRAHSLETCCCTYSDPSWSWIYARSSKRYIWAKRKCSVSVQVTWCVISLESNLILQMEYCKHVWLKIHWSHYKEAILSQPIIEIVFQERKYWERSNVYSDSSKEFKIYFALLLNNSRVWIARVWVKVLDIVL